jgi:hypothetical protein
MILLEGSDRVGKTTVAKALRDLLPSWSYRHHTKPPCDTYDYFARFLTETHPRVIVDRMHWSNFTYGHVYGDQSRLTDHQWRVLELAYLGRRAVVLYMYDELDNIKSRWGADEMYKFDEAKWVELLQRYSWLADGCRMDGKLTVLPVVKAKLPELVNLTDGKPKQLLKSIAAAAEANARHLAGWPPPSMGYGNTEPGGFLVIGEKPSYAKFDSPNFPLDMGPACEWFWRAVDAVKLRWWEGYYTNASSFRSVGDFACFVHWLKPAKVLALGGVASKLVTQGCCFTGTWPTCEVATISHPGFARRFESSQFNLWGSKLETALIDWCVNPTPSELSEDELA